MRLARAENATMMPAFLARVPRNLPLDSPLPAQCSAGDAAARGDRAAGRRPGVAVDARIARGRTYRDALRRLLEQEQFDRIIVSATEQPQHGPERRRPRMAARAGAGRGADPPARPRRHAPDLGRRVAGALLGSNLRLRPSAPKHPLAIGGRSCSGREGRDVLGPAGHRGQTAW